MRDIIELRSFWHDHRTAPLVLATLIRKQGSSYRAVGAKKIIDLATGVASGLLSGGCLEGDIIETARTREKDLPFVQSFSTLDESDRLLGYQTGCAGVIEVLFERLPEDTGLTDLYVPFGPARAGIAGVTVDLASGVRRFVDTKTDIDGRFFDSWVVPVTLTIIGCGIDAVPFAPLARELGWKMNYVDYRPPSWQVDLPVAVVPLAELAAQVPTGPHSAVVLMTHNYEADLDILLQLHDRDYGYLGCLGPRDRFRQLCADSKELHGTTLNMEGTGRVKAPAGLWPRGRNPSSVALSIVAQIESEFGNAQP